MKIISLRTIINEQNTRQAKRKFSLVQKIAMWCTKTPAQTSWNLVRDESSIASSGIYGFITPEQTQSSNQR